MKTSNKFLIMAALLLLGTLIKYDFALKAEYAKGTYKDPLYNYSQLEFKDFDQIEINPAGNIGVAISRSDSFSVNASNSVKKFLKIKKVGSKLIIDVNFDGEVRQYGFERNALVIKCPAIRSVKTEDIVYVNDKLVKNEVKPTRKDINSVIQAFFNSGSGVSINGFSQDSLVIDAKNRSIVKLHNNTLKYLKASVGTGLSGQSTLDIDQSNHIVVSELNIDKKGALWLNDVVFNDFSYKISDSAQVHLIGASLKLMKERSELKR